MPLQPYREINGLIGSCILTARRYVVDPGNMAALCQDPVLLVANMILH